MVEAKNETVCQHAFQFAITRSSPANSKRPTSIHAKDRRTFIKPYRENYGLVLTGGFAGLGAVDVAATARTCSAGCLLGFDWDEVGGAIAEACAGVVEIDRE